MKKEKMFKNEKESRTLSSADDVLSVRLGPPLPVTLVRLFCMFLHSACMSEGPIGREKNHLEFIKALDIFSNPNETFSLT